jgi:peptidoglycan/xylan/chitin deacetylase (PgdA/CDA1 family)
MPAISSLAFAALRRVGAVAVARQLRPGAVILCYHNIVDAAVSVPDPALHLQRDQFTQQIDWLAAHFEILPLAELATRAQRGLTLRGLAAITFDDAYVGTLTQGLSVLRERKLPSTVFVPTDAVSTRAAFWWDTPAGASANLDASTRTRLLEELAGDASRILTSGDAQAAAALPEQCRPAAWASLKALDSALVALESHSITHRTLPRLDDESLTLELRGSADSMERELGRRPEWIAYPYGRWDARVAAATLAAGYRGGLALDGRDFTRDSAFGSIPRLNIPAGISLDAFAAWVSGFAHWRAQRTRAASAQA